MSTYVGTCSVGGVASFAFCVRSFFTYFSAVSTKSININLVLLCIAEYPLAPVRRAVYGLVLLCSFLPFFKPACRKISCHISLECPF